MVGWVYLLARGVTHKHSQQNLISRTNLTHKSSYKVLVVAGRVIAKDGTALPTLKRARDLMEAMGMRLIRFGGSFAKRSNGKTGP